jgi:hypothetical protein
MTFNRRAKSIALRPSSDRAGKQAETSFMTGATHLSSMRLNSSHLEQFDKLLNDLDRGRSSLRLWRTNAAPPIREWRRPTPSAASHPNNAAQSTLNQR